MSGRASLKVFLANARSALKAPPAKGQRPLTFVVGNESADLDSLCSALVLAYFRTHAQPHVLHIPVCHIPREDLILRPEFAAVLEKAAATPDDVITLDELPAPDKLAAEDTQWLLVDHNAMTGRLGQLYSSRVIGCVDHHADESQVPPGSDPRIITKSGSCMSLVVEYCRATWDEISSSPASDSSSEEVDAQLAHLVIAPILIDTLSLADPHKTTDHDRHAVEWVESTKLRGAAGTGLSSEDEGYGAYCRKQFFELVSRLKEDLSRLSLRDVLRKDYKEWTDGGLRLGTSSAPQDIRTLITKAEREGRQFSEVVEDWGQEKGADIIALLTAFVKDGGGLSRELLVCARTPSGVAAAQRFEEDCVEKLGLSTWDASELDDAPGEGWWRRVWIQGQVANSRKQIAPLLRAAMKAQGEI
ncbi:hypothetical protein BX600DRAFT_446791 [Xylariales sp. PMI_506]|nr:hypothetical protein BX600DRAFT_446791 [Xylariales sp. PMI_506]